MAYYKCGSVYTTQNSNVVVDTASGAITNFQTPLAMPLLKTRFDFKATQEAGTPTPQSPKAISGVSAISVVNCNNTELAPFLRGLLQGKYGFVEMNTIDWMYSTYADVNYFVTTLSLPNVKAPEVSGQTAKAICNGYKNVPSNGVTSPVFVSGTMFIWTTGRLFLKDTNYTDVPSFVSSLQGKYLIYELATPVTPTITEEQINAICEAFNANNTLVKINLGGTYYGGYVSQDKDGKRELVVTHSDSVDLNTLTFYRATFSGNSGFYADLPNGLIKGTGSATIDGLCTNYKVTSQASMPEDKSCRFYSHTDWGGFSQIAIRDDDTIDMTGEEFTAYVTGQICYEIQNPQTIALPDGQPIKSFAGINNIFADTGDTSLQFRKIG